MIGIHELNDKNSLEVNGQNKKPRVVIIRLSSLGDIILSTIAIEILKDNFEIFFLTKEEYQKVLSNNPYVKVLTVKDSSLQSIVTSSINIRRTLKPDYVLDLHDKIPTIVIRSIIGGKIFVWDAQRIQRRKAIITKNFSNIRPTVQRFAEAALRLMSTLNISENNAHNFKNYFKNYENYSPQIFTPMYPESEKLAEFLKIANSKVHILIAPESRMKSKMWDFNECNKLILELEKKNFIVSVIGADKKNSVLYQTEHKFFGDLSLSDIKLLVNSASVVVSVDSGIMHMASALGKPLIAIFTSSVPQLGFYPYGTTKLKIIEYGNLYCRPCSLHPKDCPEKHHICSKIPYIRVLNAISGLIS